MDPRKLAYYRDLYAEYWRLISKPEPDDRTAYRIGAVLIEAVPALLDEIDRLRDRAPAEPERVRVLKMDRTGGSA